jgi:hypothetical protein
MKLVGTEPSSNCGAAKPIVVPTAELVETETALTVPKAKCVPVAAAVIVKVSEHRNTSVPNRSILRMRFVVGAVSTFEPLAKEPLTSNPEPTTPDDIVN